jgi:hypothetical protein
MLAVFRVLTRALELLALLPFRFLRVLSDKLRYDAERVLGDSIYDARGNFVGTFDPRLESLRDINCTDLISN